MKPKAVAVYQEALVKAGLWDMVHAELTAARFDLADLIGHVRNVARLNRLRFRIWAKARSIKEIGASLFDGDHMYSFPELGRLFNRDHSTIISGVVSANIEAVAKSRKKRRATR